MEYRSLFETDTDTLLSEISSLEQQQQQQQQQPTTQQSMYTGQYNYGSNQATPAANGQYSVPGTGQTMYQSSQQQSHYMNANSYYSNQQTPQQQQMMTANMKSNWQSNSGQSTGTGIPGSSTQAPPAANGSATTIQNVQINVQNNFNIAKNMQQANLNQFSTASSTTATNTTTGANAQPWAQYNPSAAGQYAPNSATTGKPIVNMSNVPQQQQQQQMYKLNQFGTAAKPSPPPVQAQQQPQQGYMNSYQPAKPNQQLQPPPQPQPPMGYQTGQPTPQTVMKINQPVPVGQPPQQQQQHSAYQPQTVNSNTGYPQPLSSLPPHMQQQQPMPQQPQQQPAYGPYNNQANAVRQPAPYQPSPNKSQQQPPVYAPTNVNSVNLNQPQASGASTASQQLSPNRINPTPGGGYYQTSAYPQQQQSQLQPQPQQQSQYPYMNQNQPNQPSQYTGAYPNSGTGYPTTTTTTTTATTTTPTTTPNRMNTMYNTNINSGGIVVGSGGYPPPAPGPQTPMGLTNTNVLNNTISPVGAGDSASTTPTKRGRGKAKPKTDTGSSPEDGAEKGKGKGKRGKNKQQTDLVEQTPPTPTGMNAATYGAPQQQPPAYNQSPSSMNRLPMVTNNTNNPAPNMMYPTGGQQQQQQQPQQQQQQPPSNMLQRNDYSTGASLSPQSANATSMYKPAQAQPSPQQQQPAYSNHMNMMSYSTGGNSQNQQPNTQPYMMPGQPMQPPPNYNQSYNKPPLQQQQQHQPANAQPPFMVAKKPDDMSMYGQPGNNMMPMSMSQPQPNVTVGGPSNVMMPQQQQQQQQPVLTNQYMPTPTPTQTQIPTQPLQQPTNVNTLVNTSTFNMSGQMVKPNLEPSHVNNHQYHPQQQQQQLPQQPLTSPSQVPMLAPKPNMDPMGSSQVNYPSSYMPHPVQTTQPTPTPIVVTTQPTPYMINNYGQSIVTAPAPAPAQPAQPPVSTSNVGPITITTQQSPAVVVVQPLSTPTPIATVQLQSPHEPMNGTAPLLNDPLDSLAPTMGESNSTTKSPAKKLTKKQLKLLNTSNGGVGESELAAGDTPSPAKKQRKIRPKKSLDNNEAAPLDPEANSKIDETLDDLMRKFSQQADDESGGEEEAVVKKNKKGPKKGKKKQPASEDKPEAENDEDDESGGGDDDEDSDDADEDEDDDDPAEDEENDKPVENGTNSELDTSGGKKALKKMRNVTGKKRAERKPTIKNLVEGEMAETGDGDEPSAANDDDGEPKKAKRKYTKKKFRFQPQSGDEASDSLTLTTVKLLNDDDDESQSQSQSNLLGGGDDSTMATTPATGKKGGRKPKLNKLVADESTTSLSTLAATPIPNITLPQLGPVSSNRGRRKSAHHLVKLMKKTKRKKRKKTSSGEEDADDDDDSDEFELPVTKGSAAKKEDATSTTTAQLDPDQTTTTTTNNLGEELTGCGASMADAATASNDEATAKLLQASEKRRSTRTTASKRQKYTDEDYKLKDEDLLMPQTDTADDQAAEQAAVNGSIVFASHDSLIVDKILGVRLVKRKTKRKKEKVPKPPKAEPTPVTKTQPEPTSIVKEATEVKKEEKPAEVDETTKKTDEAETVTAPTTETSTKESEPNPTAPIEPIDQKAPSPQQQTLSSTEEAEKSEAKPTTDEPTKPTDEPMESEPKVENEPTVAIEATEKPVDESMKVDEPTEVNPPATESKEAAVEESCKMDVDDKDVSKEDKKDSTDSEAVKIEQKEDKPAAEAEVVKPDEPEPEPEEEAEEEESEWEEDGGEIEVEEFYVKYKNLSYLHCEWKSRDELFYSDKRIDQKIKRFKLKKQQQQQMYDWNDDGDTANGYNNDYDELFNPDYVVIDRILDEYDVDDTLKPGTKIKYFLIKWKALPYEDASWELESDVKNTKKIERFHRFNTCVPDIHLRTVTRPKPDRWTPMSESRAYKNDNKLREYQLEGINWLTFCWINGRNCILADEMGLGKTVQSITFLQEVANYGVRGPYLILVPLSTIGNWIREFETWTDFNVIVYHGSSQSRQMIQDYEFYFKEEALVAANVSTKTNKNVVKFNALITTYEVLLSDVPLFCQFKWRSVIIDEAHRLKNKNCKLIEGLRYMDVEHKVLLTGTPLQNNVEELFSLLNFLEPSQFHSSVEFMQDFGDLKTDTQVTKLQAVLKPMMLRRLKEDVEKNLAPKEETIVEVELTNTQKKYYRAILEKNFQFLTRGVSSSNVPNLMNTMMELRKCCNHPYLINGAEDNIIAEFADRLKSTPDEPRLSHDKLALKAMVQASGKLVLVDKLLPKLKAGGHKVLIFSQMIRVLDIIEDYLIQMRFTYERLDGRIRGEMRQEAIDRYSKPDSDRFAFLLCTRAGGLGINLTAADTVIIYDSDWNPQNDLQAQARCHRIGQSKSVKIYRLITRNTYEREMFDRASLKLGLDKAILQSMRNEDKFNQSATANNSMQLSKKEIEDLLKKGAYGAIMEDDAAADKFCEEDIDKILQQRSTVIQIEGGEKGSTFSKASFQTSETNDISIDDPEFWQKWAKKADIDIEEKLNPKDERIIYEPRRRTQTRRYGGPDDLLEESEYSSSSSDENDPNKDQNKDPKTRKGKRGKRDARGGDDATFNAEAEEAESSNVWSRDECYKVEKNLLIFGWSRWSRILKSCEFTAKRVKVQTEQDVESLARAIVAFTLKNYNGDESIKQFIIDLIDPSKSNFDDLKNHEGLAAPVARGRKPRKADETVPEEAAVKPAAESETTTTKPDDVLEWAKNVGDLLADDNYKKHLVRQANRILLRLRMLFYIKHEIIGDEYAAKLDADECVLAHDSIDLQLPEVQVDLPAEWWDKTCDVSMLVGVYKHGFEKYYQMRTDAQLCFLSLCGPPDATDDLLEQQRLQDNEANEEEKNVDADGVDETAPATLTESTTEKEKDTANSTTADSTAFKKFPTVSELNNRLRRLIASVQKFKKQEQLMSKRNAERQEKRLSKLASNQERAVMRQMEKQSKWSRREEQSFYKAISTYGVDCIDKTAGGTYSWEKFKEISQLDKKLDETLTDYYTSFLYMCRRVCHKISDDEPPPANEVPVEIISEERASRCLQRIDLLNKIRNDVLKSEHFDDWIMNRCLGSVDLPDWYVPGRHDRDLVKAAARYGITRTEYYYVNDREFTFKNYLYKYMMHIEQLMNEDALGADPTAPANTDPIQYYFQNQAKIQVTFRDLINNELILEQELASKKSSKMEPEAKADSPAKVEVENEQSKSPPKLEDEKSKSPLKLEDEKPKSPPKVEDDKPKSPQAEQDKAKSPSKSPQREPDQVLEEETDIKEEDKVEKEEEKETPIGDESLAANKSELYDTSQKDLIIDETVMETSTAKAEIPSDEADDKEKESKPEADPSSPVKVKSETTEDVEMEVSEAAALSPAKAKSPAKSTEDVQIDEEKVSIKEEDKSDKPSSPKSKDDDKPTEAEDQKSAAVETDEAANKVAEEKVQSTEIDLEPKVTEPKAADEQATIEFTSNNPVIQSYFANNTVPMIMWPKDRVIYNRLEQIIQMFENDGEWPQRNMFMFGQQTAANGVHASNSNSNLMPNAGPMLNGGAGSTPLSTPSNSLSISNLIGSSSNANLNLLAEQRKLMMSPMLLGGGGDTSAMDDDDDTASNNNDPDSADFYAKLVSNPNSQKPKRGRPPKLDLPQLASALGVSASAATAIPADPSNKIRHLLNSIGVAGSPSTNPRSRLNPDQSWHKSDQDGMDDVDVDLPPLKASSKLDESSNNKSGFLEPGEIFRPIGNSKSSSTRSAGSKPQPSSAELENNDSTNGLIKPSSNPNQNNPNNKRSRKSMPQSASGASINQPPTQQATSAQPTGGGGGNVNQIDLAALASLFLGQGQDPDERITVINIEDGSRLIGSKAPKRIELPIWLMTHPNYLPDESEIINMTLKNPNIANNLAALYQNSLVGGEPPPPAQTPPSRSGQRRNNNNGNGKKPPTSPIHSDEEELERPASSNSSITQPSPSPGRSSSRMEAKSRPSLPPEKRQTQQPPNGQQPGQSMFDSNSPLVLFNKVTNKRIDRSKIPNWKSLCSFLDKNEQVYIDPCSNELIRSRYGKNIPDIIRSRMLNRKNPVKQQQQEKQSSPAPQRKGPQQAPNSKSQQQQQQQQPPAPSTPNAAQQQAAAAANMFNPFSPNSAAQLQGLGELLAASGGNIDFNNPLAGFMAAALAAQSTGPAGAPSGFNPFLLPPPLGLPPGAASPNPLIDLLSKMPPGFDMSSLDELTALAALQGAAMGSSLPPPPTTASPSLAPPKPNEPKPKNNPPSAKQPTRASNDMKKPQQQSSIQQQQQQPSKELRSRDNATKTPSVTNSNKPSSNSIESKLNPPQVDVRKPKSGQQQQQQQQSSKQSKESKASTSQNALAAQNQQANIDFAAVAAAMQQLDPNANVAALAAMMEQEKLMQDMMNLSQLTGGNPFGAANPFLFGAGSTFPPPPPPPPQQPTHHVAKSSRGRSPTPDRDRSVSPANSVASNMSQKHNKSSSSAAANQPALDFNLFMNNFMNYQLAGGGPLAPPPPPPPLGGLPSLNDLSKLPVELLTALTAAASGGAGLPGLDPTMFSALAQLNSLSANVANDEMPASTASTSSRSSKSASSSSFPKQQHQQQQQQSSSKLTPASSKGPSSGRRESSSSSSTQLSKKPRIEAPDGSDFYQQGLDLSLKTNSRPSASKQQAKPRLKSPQDDD